MSGRVDLEVQKALAKAKGNKLLAQKELVSAVLNDDDLLRELVAPFLKPITAQAIERTLNAASRPPAARSLGGSLSGAAKVIAKELKAGYNPMRSTLGNDPQAGTRPPASSRHVSTLKLLAKAYEMKRG